MSSHRVLVTFAVPPSFQSSDSCKQVITALRSQLPLRSIHWKSASRPSIRTIQELEVTLVALDSLRDELTSQVPLALLEKPLLNLYVVACEDNEVYRATVKRQIKDWQASVLPRKNQEWLIVHIVRPDTKSVDRKFFNMKGSVLDKIKADFNVDKRDRCVQLAWSAGEQSPAIWADLISKIKDGLLSALDNSVISREEELKRSESQRHMPGWNFCTYFILKESLATSYEGINLFEDALQQYDELEAAFMQVLREKNMSWFGSVIHPVPNDDSMPLLSTSKKPYRDLILANTISVFDLRVYLLSRQSVLLSKLCQPSEICWKAFMFLTTFGSHLKEIEPSLPQYFVESWTFSSAISVLDQCDSWASSWPEMDSQTQARYNARKGELIELAKSQLDILGIREGFLPSKPPFSLAIPASIVTSDLPIMSHKSSDHRISKREIISAIADKVVFYDLYTTISNRAIDMYVKAGRRKFALKIHGSLAVLDVYRGRLPNALTIFTSLPAHYAPHRWTSLESLMLSRAIDTHAALNKPRDREWIHIVLAFLKTYVNDRNTELVMSDENLVQYIVGLVRTLRGATEKLDSDFIHPDHPVISVSAAGGARASEDEDTLFLEVTVKNRLPCDVVIDEVNVTLTGQDTNRLIFAAHINTLSPGDNHLTLSCAVRHSLDAFSEIFLATDPRQHVAWSHKTLSASSIPAKGTMLPLVRLPFNSRGLSIELHRSHEVDLGATSRMLLSLSTGHNDISMATIKLSAPGGVNFDYFSVQVQNPVGDFLPSENGIKIANVPKYFNMIILIPHTDASRFSAMKIDVKVTYSTVSQPTVLRTLRKSHTVNVSLPIAVNVEDFFRGKRLFSKFTISATTRERVRLFSVALQGPTHGPDDAKIVNYRSSHDIMTVTPENPVNHLFCVDCESGPVLDPLKLVIVYRMLREEAVALITQTMLDLIQTSHTTSQGQELEAIVIQYLDYDTTWVELYSATGELLIPSTLEIPEGLGGLFASLQQKLAHSRPPTKLLSPWREIRIPVDVPRMNINTSARVRINSGPFGNHEKPASIYAGQPICGILSIRTSLHWGDPESKRPEHVLRYDVEERVKDWLICGRKRGEFIARDEKTFSVPLTLIALHHGELTLPKIDVKPSALAGDTMATDIFPSTDTHQAHGAETILVLPRGGRSTFVVGMGSQEE